jgi:excisionase family DNA binding protein
MEESLLKSKEVAQRLGISKAYAYRLMKIGAIPSVKVGSRAVRCRPEDVEDFILANLQTNENSAGKETNIDDQQSDRIRGKS